MSEEKRAMGSEINGLKTYLGVESRCHEAILSVSTVDENLAYDSTSLV